MRVQNPVDGSFLTKHLRTSSHSSVLSCAVNMWNFAYAQRLSRQTQAIQALWLWYNLCKIVQIYWIVECSTIMRCAVQYTQNPNSSKYLTDAICWNWILEIESRENTSIATGLYTFLIAPRRSLPVLHYSAALLAVGPVSASQGLSVRVCHKSVFYRNL